MLDMLVIAADPTKPSGRTPTSKDASRILCLMLRRPTPEDARDFLGGLHQWARKTDVTNVGALLFNDDINDDMCRVMHLKHEDLLLEELLEAYPAVRNGEAVGVAYDLPITTWELFL